MPAIAYPHPDPITRPSRPSGVAREQRVLVVEDDAALLGTVDVLLRHYDYVPHLAPTLAEACRYLAGADPDVVLLDLNLPDGNGVDLLEHLRSTGRRARVVVLTAGSTPEHLRRLRDLRPDRVYVKPLNFLDLLDGLRGDRGDPAIELARAA